MAVRGVGAVQRWWRRGGFTIIEIMVVVVIVGVMLGVALPRFPVSTLRANAAVRVLRSEFGLAQRLAITRQSNVVIGIDLDLGRLRVLEDADNDERADPGERVRVRPLEENVAFRVPGMGGVNGTSVGAAFVGSNLRVRDGIPSLVYHRDGSASTDLELYLSSRADEPESWRAVVVAPSTGRAEAWRVSAASWRRMRP